MNIHYLQHVPFEGTGFIEQFLHRPEHKVTATRFYEDSKLPFVEICDMLIVLGGPMGVHDTDKIAWLDNEKKFIEKVIQKGKKVLGICLGAQLIAEVLGARVYKNKETEIGWHEVQFTPEIRKNKYFSSFSEKQHVFHWHGDTFDIPSGSIPIGSSAACANQGFVYNDHVVALQFHLETTVPFIEGLIGAQTEPLPTSPFVQSLEEIRNEEYMYRNNKLMMSLLEKF